MTPNQTPKFKKLRIEHTRPHLAILREENGYAQITIDCRENFGDSTQWTEAIQAIPAMYEALEAMLDHFGILEDNPLLNKDAVKASKKAKAALKLARGES